MTRRMTFAIMLVVLLLALCGCSAGSSGGNANAETSGSASASQPASQDGTASSDSETNYSKARVSYLGPQGTYTQEACEAFFGSSAALIPADDVSASVQALVSGEVDYAVIPQENTIGGSVAEYLDEVVGNEGLSIAGEVELRIDQNLLVKPGAKLEDIQVVYSHKQGIAQGLAWLGKNLPQAEIVEVSSTAEGAKRASEDETGTASAIGAAAAAQVYSLEVAAEAIQENDANETRFYVLSTDEPAAGPLDRMAFTAAGKAEDLPDLLSSVEAAGLEVVAVHDRPEKTELGRYVYLVECTGGGSDAFQAVRDKRGEFSLRYLGSFPLARPGA